jgi:hypothetical protein
MKPLGEKLYFERSDAVDKATAGLLKRVLRNRGESADPGSASLRERMDKWLDEGIIQSMLPLSVDDVKACVEIIQSQVEIAEEAPGANEPNGTSSPHNISLAKGLLPEMGEFVAGQETKAA